jgi:Ca-activated chloride channel family protein
MTFGHPLLLLTLLVIPAAAALYLSAQRRRARYAVRFTNVDLLAALVERRSWRRWVPPVFFALALASVGVALARPHVKTLVPKNDATVVLVIDASRSMQAQDVKPSRVGAAIEAVQRFLDLVPKHLRVALVVFSGDAQVGAPPTRDHDLVRRSLATIPYFNGYGGTAIGDALALAVKLGERAIGAQPQRTLSSVGAAAAPAAGARSPVSILFLSDGRQNRGILSPLAGAQMAKQAGFPVYTIALGTRNAQLPGLPTLPPSQFPPALRFNLAPDPATLQAIADVSGGQFFRARSADALRSAFTHLGTQLGREPGRSEITYAFLAGAAALLLGSGLLSALWSPRLP